MYEFRGAREAERSFAERGSANQTRGRDAYEAAMAANEESGAAARNAAAAAAAQQIMNVHERDLAELAAARSAADSEQFRQAGFDAYQAQLADAAAAAQANIAAAPENFFGTPTRFMNNLFLEGLGSRIGGRGSEAYNLFLSDPNLFAPVYDTTGRLTGYRDERGRLTGRDPIADAAEQERRRLEEGGEPEIAGTVTDPVTGQQKCPDGYIFDEDLQACRKKPMERAAVDTAPGERYIRSGLLDVAPEGLMGFQERYGAGFGSPMDFAAANREFRMGGAVTPSFYSAPPKLDGYTLLT